MLEKNICPYPGLRPFNEDESVFYKGREDHINTIISQLQEKKFLMVTGASGDGKSSLIYAGLIPRSRAGFFKAQFNNWIVADFKPERAPLSNLAITLNKHLSFDDVKELEENLSYGFSSLVKIYKESKFYVNQDNIKLNDNDTPINKEISNKGANLLILIDQFEELFTNAENFNIGKPSLQAITLINLIIETTQLAEKENLPIYIVCTMRSDYIGDCAAFKGLPELIVYSQFFVPRLKRQEIHRAILEPANLSGNKINNRLIERLINELGDGIDQLPILQHALNRIWKSHIDDGAKEMDILHYAKVGGLDAALLPEDQKKIYNEWIKNQPLFKLNILKNSSLGNVLNAHARELFESSVAYYCKHINEKVTTTEAHKILQKIFTCLTKVNDGRAVRNRSTVKEIKQIIGSDIDNVLIEGLVNSFRESGNTLLKPFINNDEKNHLLLDDDILDITHESLIRNWAELTEWTKEDHEQVLVLNDFKKQVERWEITNRSKDFLLTIGSLSYFKTWFETINPNKYLAAKYDSSSKAPEQKINEAAIFINSAIDYLELSESTIKKKRKAIAIISTLMILVLLGFTSWAFWERNKAVDQQVIANIKTVEAKNAEKLALNSERIALKAKNAALFLKEKAEISEKFAQKVKRQAELSNIEAINAKGIAEIEKRNAQKQTNVAKTEKDNAEREKTKAEQEKIKAEQEKTKAEKAELKSRKLKLLSIAQNLALKSTLYKKNINLSGQLALQAFMFNKNNGGLEEDQVIYEGLRNAYSLLDSSKSLNVFRPAMEIRALKETNNMIISASLDGKLYKQNNNSGPINLFTEIKFTSPINTLYFGENNKYFVTAHDNYSISLWDIKTVLNNTENKILNPNELKGHNGLVRSISFSSNANFIATGGKDSSIIIWNIKEQTTLQVKKIKASAAIKYLIYSANDLELIAAQEDGKIVMFNISSGEEKIVSNNVFNKPLCMAINKLENKLLVGFSDGTIINFDLDFKDINKINKVEFKAHSAAIENIVFNNNFTMVASTASDKSVKFYNYNAYFENINSTGKSIDLKNNNSKVKSIIFTSDNKIIAACSDKVIKIWETSSEKLVENICSLLTAKITEADWKLIVDEDIQFEKTCKEL